MVEGAAVLGLTNDAVRAVLSIDAVAEHPHNSAGGTFVEHFEVLQPRRHRCIRRRRGEAVAFRTADDRQSADAP